MHAKRQTINKSWPIPRKGTKYVIVASHDKNRGIPLLVILRDILKLASNRREIRKILQDKLVSVNWKVRREENFAVLPFDILKIGEKNYELRFSEKGMLEAKETNRKDIILKVVDKKTLKKKTQLNLLYGRNILTDKEVKVGDSVVIKEKKIEKVLNLEKGKEAIIFAGKYTGRKGKIDKIEEKTVFISSKDEKVNVPIKNIMVIN